VIHKREIIIMQKAEFESIIELKVQVLISLLMESENKAFLDALEYLYESELYAALANESTKLWHLSAEKLYDMLKNEKLTHKLEYPDE
jgi:hypothetical protein